MGTSGSWLSSPFNVGSRQGVCVPIWSLVVRAKTVLMVAPPHRNLAAPRLGHSPAALGLRFEPPLLPCLQPPRLIRKQSSDVPSIRFPTDPKANPPQPCSGDSPPKIPLKAHFCPDPTQNGAQNCSLSQGLLLLPS